MVLMIDVFKPLNSVILNEKNHKTVNFFDKNWYHVLYQFNEIHTNASS
jgi:hypothetical protein